MVQMWTINYNDEFRTAFRETTENPNPDKFKPQAVENLYKTVVGLWGEAAREEKVKYCVKTTQNIDRVYVGTGDQFKALFNVKGIKESIGITQVTEDEIIVETIDKKGHRGAHTWPYGKHPEVQQVLYKRKGFTSFMCLKPLSQFEAECTLHGQIHP